MTKVFHEVPAEWKRTPNSTQASDCDVLAEIWATRDLLPATARPAVLHIKGHQEKKTACEQLPLPAQLNVDADKLAGDYMTNHPNSITSQQPETFLFPPSLFDNVSQHFSIVTFSIATPGQLRDSQLHLDLSVCERLKCLLGWSDLSSVK